MSQPRISPFRLWVVAASIICLAAGCGSTDPRDMDQVEKAKRISELRKQGEEMLSIFVKSAEDPEGADLEALEAYVACHRQTTEIDPMFCPLCFANYGAGLRRLGVYYQTLVAAFRRGMETASPAERTDMEAKVTKYEQEMLGNFRRSNAQFENYFMSCRRNNEVPHPETYAWVFRNAEALGDFRRALEYLDLYKTNVPLSDQAKSTVEQLRKYYAEQLILQEKKELYEELKR